MLRLRGAFDPKRFYKSVDNSKFPKYFQMGTVVEGPTDFYSGASPIHTHLPNHPIKVLPISLQIEIQIQSSN